MSSSEIEADNILASNFVQKVLLFCTALNFFQHEIEASLICFIAASLLEDNKVDAARSLLRLRNIEGIDTLLENMTPDDLNHIVQYKPHNL